MNLKKTTLTLLAALPLMAAAQQIKPSYVDWGVTGGNFSEALQTWEKGMKWSDDDNFFISRVRPKLRFRNTATQVNPALTEENDKNLIFWVPINNQTFNALPDGVYDSEVFPMWSYVTHYGNWSTPLIRVPGNFSDVAHKNGVAVSAVASVPYGNISTPWYKALSRLASIGPDKVSDFLDYYGVDGIGYNSEFSTTKTLVKNLRTLHEGIIKNLRETGRNPIAEIIWYDGTDDSGQISFDYGLRKNHNLENWGYGENIRSSLFFNYNWNSASLLQTSVETANSVGRSPLDLYCGINMQGKEPKYNTDKIWTLLKDYNLSIGLWGAHSMNMFFESRAEKGPKPDVRQRTYMLRMEKWFTGGSRNPINSPEINNSLKIAADNDEFFGMSKLMTARSSLKWDLSEEPFITYFNLGNGKFFNYRGQRCHNAEWYNIGIQDYLPTWMWWFSSSFIGRNPSDVPSNGLNAEFVWDDAWMGGSLVRINGSTTNEYLHLFKTEFPLASGDEVTVRYKVINGSADASLVMSARGSETTESAATILDKDAPLGAWVEKKFTIGKEFASMAGKDVAMIALNFKNAKDLDIRLGEFSIVRPNATSVQPAKPVIEKAEILSARHDGADGKIIFNMPNDKGNDKCYNIDVNTSLFKLYATWEGAKSPVLMGMTTSWAGLLFSIPTEYAKGKKVALGVSAMSLDMTKESEIAWSEFMPLDDVFEPSDRVVLSKNVIKPGEAFSVGYADPTHDLADWALLDIDGKTVSAVKNSLSMEFPDGIDKTGNYTVKVTGTEHKDGATETTTREYIAMVQVTSPESGNIPQITSATVNGKNDSELTFDKATRTATINFEALSGEATLSRGVRIGESGLGFRYADTGLPVNKSFSVSFWIKPDDFKDKAAHLLNIRDKEDKWANNNWGWFWHTVNENGITDAFTMRMNTGGNVNYRFDNTKIEPGVWHHLAYVFDFNASGEMVAKFFLDGQEQTVTSWTRGEAEKDGAPTAQGPTYSWRENNAVAVGGYLHNSGSATGNVDNLMLWNKALDAADVRKAMEDVKESELPEGLVALFDFEKNHNSDYTFTAAGPNGVKGGNHDYLATEVEGQGRLKWIEPEYCAGAPHLSGNSFELKTEASFFNDGGSVTDVKGDNKAGSATLNFPAEGVYFAGIKLTNEYGSDTRNFVVNVGEDSCVTPVELRPAMEVGPNPFSLYIDVTADSDALYRLTLTDLDGRRLMSNEFNAFSGEKMRICPEVAPGLYLLLIEKDGKPYTAVKVIRK